MDLQFSAHLKLQAAERPAIQLAAPSASPSIYVGMAPGVTFPLNILVGVPAYLAIVQALWP